MIRSCFTWTWYSSDSFGNAAFVDPWATLLLMRTEQISGIKLFRKASLATDMSNIKQFSDVYEPFQITLNKHFESLRRCNGESWLRMLLSSIFKVTAHRTFHWMRSCPLPLLIVQTEEAYKIWKWWIPICHGRQWLKRDARVGLKILYYLRKTNRRIQKLAVYWDPTSVRELRCRSWSRIPLLCLGASISRTIIHESLFSEFLQLRYLEEVICPSVRQPSELHPNRLRIWKISIRR